MLMCETDPHPTRDVLWKSYLKITRNASQKLFYLFVLLQVLPSVYSRKYKHNHWWHRAPSYRCTWATRGGYSYATTASWQLLWCGKNTQFFHEGVSKYAQNTFKRVTEGIVLTEKHSRRIIFKPFLGNHLKVWDFLCHPISAPVHAVENCIVLNKQYAKIFDT